MALRKKCHNSILLNVQERQKPTERPTHFYVFYFDKQHFKQISDASIGMHEVLTQYAE